MIIRLSSLTLILALGTLVCFQAAEAGAPCCAITGVDAKAQVVTARDIKTGRTFQFKVADRKALGALNVGQAVYADFTTMNVSLTVDGAAPCCAIVNLRAPAR